MSLKISESCGIPERSCPFENSVLPRVSVTYSAPVEMRCFIIRLSETCGVAKYSMDLQGQCMPEKKRKLF